MGNTIQTEPAAARPNHLMRGLDPSMRGIEIGPDDAPQPAATGPLDFIVARNVHRIADLPGWFAWAHGLLSPQGTLRLGIPDIRYAIDYKRPVTTHWQVLERDRPSGGWAFTAAAFGEIMAELAARDLVPFYLTNIWLADRESPEFVVHLGPSLHRGVNEQSWRFILSSLR